MLSTHPSLSMLFRVLSVLLLSASFALITTGCTRSSASEWPTVTVYQNPACGCCTKWIDYLKGEGFDVETVLVETTYEIRVELGMPHEAASCHTATIGDYVIEGHVPAEAIRRLLEEAPEAVGLAVPGMPAGSPGMHVEGQEAPPYDVWLIHGDGYASVFSQH